VNEKRKNERRRRGEESKEMLVFMLARLKFSPQIIKRVPRSEREFENQSTRL